jgi:hypothetical protein
MIPLVLFWKHKLTPRIIQAVLIILGLEWIRTIVFYTKIRMENAEDWLRLVIILAAVTLIHFATVLIFRTSYMKKRYGLR